jgi:hypothetical protein
VGLVELQFLVSASLFHHWGSHVPYLILGDDGTNRFSVPSSKLKKIFSTTTHPLTIIHFVVTLQPTNNHHEQACFDRSFGFQ